MASGGNLDSKSQGLPQSEKISVFLTKGLTGMTFGSTWLPQGAAIGLPRTVLFQSPEDIRNSFLESAGTLYFNLKKSVFLVDNSRGSY